MSTIKIEDLDDAELVTLNDEAQVKGGAAYIKFDGVDGESTRKDHKGEISVLKL